MQSSRSRHILSRPNLTYLLTLNKRKQSPVGRMYSPNRRSLHGSIFQLILKVSGCIVDARLRPTIHSHLGFAMPFPRLIPRARRSPSLGLLPSRVNQRGGPVRRRRHQFFGFLLKESLEAQKYVSPVAVIPAGRSQVHLRWIIRMIARCSRQCTARNRFLLGLDARLMTWH